MKRSRDISTFSWGVWCAPKMTAEMKGEQIQAWFLVLIVAPVNPSRAHRVCSDYIIPGSLQLTTCKSESLPVSYTLLWINYYLEHIWKYQNSQYLKLDTILLFAASYYIILSHSYSVIFKEKTVTNRNTQHEVHSWGIMKQLSQKKGRHRAGSFSMRKETPAGSQC